MDEVLDRPKSEPTVYDAMPQNGWAHKNPDDPKDWNWNGLQKIFDGYSKEKQDSLREQIRVRREVVKQIRDGRGDFADQSLGITIIRFTINELKVLGDVAKAAEQAEKERREKEADQVEIENISDRAKKLMTDHGLSAKDAFKIIQVERGKATRTTIDVDGARTDAGQDLLGLAGVAREFLAELRGDKKKDSSSEKSSEGKKERTEGRKGKKRTKEEIKKFFENLGDEDDDEDD